MTEREVYRQIFSEIAEKRIHNDECPNCGLPKTEWKRRTDWRCCSTKCTEQFWEEHNKSWSWGNFRIQVFKRDNGICKMCKKKFTFISYHTKEEIPDYSKLIADHIKPLAIDGEMWDIKNLQTLCIDCNKIKTKKDMRDIANYRKGKLKVMTKQLVIN